MEYSFQCDLTTEDIRNSLKSTVDKKGMKYLLILYIILVILLIYSTVMIIKSNDLYDKLLFGVSLIGVVFITLLGVLMLVSLKKIKYQNIMMNYTLYDDYFVINSSTNGVNGSEDRRYDTLEKIVINEDYILLYINKQQFFTIKINCIEDAMIDEVKSFFKEKSKLMKNN